MDAKAVSIFNRYLTEAPEKTFFKVKCKDFALNLLAKISWVALFAILAVILTISYSGVTLTANATLAVAASAVATPVIACGLTKIAEWRAHYSPQAEAEGYIALLLKNKISHWEPKEIEQFLCDEGIGLEKIPLDLLRKINPKKPLCALQPLIARFIYYKGKAEVVQKMAQNAPDALEKKLTQKTPENEKQLLRYQTQSTSWTQQMGLAIPAALNAAVMLKIMQQPTLKNLTNYSNIGKYSAKSFEQWLFDQAFKTGNDHCFRFFQKNRPSLTLTEILQDMTPKALYLKLFPKAVQA